MGVQFSARGFPIENLKAFPFSRDVVIHRWCVRPQDGRRQLGHAGTKSTGGAGTICRVSCLTAGSLQPVYFTTMESSTLQLGFPA